MGAVAAAFVVFMVLSGLAINHSSTLDLEKRKVSASFLLDYYGLEAPQNMQSFAVGDNWLSLAGSQVYLNEKNVSSLSNGIGAVANDFMIVVAGQKELLLLDHEGGLIERMPWSNADAESIESIGLVAGQQVVVKSASGNWLADEALLDWQNSERTQADIAWANPAATPESLQTSITRSYRGDGLSLQRLLLDFHSGRIFGPVGVLVYDLLALTIGGLAISGLVFWVQSRRNGRNGKNKRQLKR